ncbi:MAG: immunoglobulin domain-containing protein [Verrucomicrobiota bacterium]
MIRDCFLNHRRCLWLLLLLLIGSVNLAQAQSLTPVTETWQVTGDPAPNNGTFVGSVLPIDANTQYIIAGARGSLRQDVHQLVTVAPGQPFYSLIKKPVNGPSIWSREIIGQVMPHDMALMPDGGVVMVGYFQGTVLFKTNAVEGLSVTSKGAEDFFVARYLANGSLCWVRAEGSTAADVAIDVAADSLGNIAVAGTMGGPGNVAGTTIFSQGMFLAKYLSDGSMPWMRPVFGNQSYATSVTADNLGHFYIAGHFRGSVHAGGTDLDAIRAPNWYDGDSIIMKYDMDGHCEWVQQIGNYSWEHISHIQADGFNGLVVVGEFLHATSIGPFYLTDDSYNYYNSHNAFVAKLSTTGTWEWAKTLPGDEHTRFTALDVDSLGEIYVAGHFWGTIEVNGTNLVSDDYLNYDHGEVDGFIMRLSPDGSPAWGMKFDGDHGSESVTSLKVISPDQGVFSYTGNSYYGGYGYTYGYTYSWGYWGFDYGYHSGDTRLGRFLPPTALQLIQPPVKTTAFVGEPVSIRVVVIGTSPSYQWIKDGKDILGATSSVHTIAAAASKDVGEYSVRITNPNSTITTTPVVLGLYVRPQFTTKPDSLMVSRGSDVTLQAQATGIPNPALRWRKHSTGGGVQTGPTFHLDDVTLEHDGAYTLEAHTAAATNSHPFRIYVDMIPAALGAEVVHDPYREVLYVSTGTNIARFHLPTKTLLAPFTVGQNLGSLDISADGKSLVVADSFGTAASNLVYFVNLETGAATEVALAKTAGENGIVDVACGADGRVLLATQGKLRSYDPVTGEVILLDRPGSSMMAVSADRQTLALIDFNEPNGNLYRYAVSTTNITGSGTDGLGSLGRDVGIDRLGRQFAQVNAGKAVFYDESLQVITTLGTGPADGPGGVVYHPQQDLVFLSWQGTNEVRAYSTVTFTEVARYQADNLPFAEGLSMAGAGRLRISRSGDLLLVALPNGIRYLPLTPQLPALLNQPAPRTAAGGEPVTFEVAASSSQTLQYQWQKNGENILNATNRILQLPFADSSRAGHYRVRVTNTTGTVTSEAALLTVVRGDPQVAWLNPGDIAYGTALGPVQLNATAITPGTYVYDPPAGTKFPVGNGHVLQVIFSPADTAAFAQVTNTVQLNVLKKFLTVTTPNVSRQFGLSNPVFPVNIAGFEPGESAANLDTLPVISTAATEASPVGTYAITISGGADNNYDFIHGNATLTISKRVVAITLQNLDQPYNGTPRPITTVTSPAGVPLSITYNGGATVPTLRGTYPVSVAVTDANYQGSASGTLNIFKGSPLVTWNTPAPVLVGTALGGTQLNATAPISGIYAYTPAAGTILATGQHTLTLIFTPLDSANYLRATNTVTMQILPLTLANPHHSSTNPNEFRFDFNGINGVEYLVEISTDLVQWTTLTTFTAQNGSVPITDPSIFSNQKRFYRIRPKP